MKNHKVLLFIFLLSTLKVISYEINTLPTDPLINRKLTKDMELFFLKNKPIIISLGDSCQPAMNLRRNKLRFMAYPFDWAITRFDDLYNILETDFAKCKKVEHFSLLEVETKNIRPINIYYPKLQFPHVSNENLIEDLNRRIERFYRTIEYAKLHEKKVTFMIHSNLYKDISIKDKARNLVGLLQRKFKGLKLHLIIMHHANIDDKLNLKNCTFCFLQHQGWTQESYLEWTKKFKQIGLI